MLTGFGAATMIVAAVLSLRVTDLKLLLAYSTIMALGTLMFLLASGDAASVEAAMIFLVAHAIYKGALFLCVGGVNHETGTRELSELGGLVKFMPIIFLAVLFSAISMAGLPPVLGFISKEAIYSARLAEPEMDWLLIAIAVITNAVFFTLALIVTIKPFLRRAPYQATAKIITDPGVSLWLPPVLLSLIGFAFGLNPSLIDDTIIAPPVASIMQKNITVELKLWHGVSPALLLSLGTFVMGAIIYFLYMKVRSFLQRSRLIDIISPSTCYEKSLKALQVFAFRVTSFLHNGYLRVYLTIVFLCMSILTFFTFFYFEHIPPTHIMPNAPWFGWLIAIVMVIGAFALVINAPYLASLVFLGVIGLCSTLIFLLFSAPDVAMTQILVDVLTIVIVVLALYRLPSIPPYQKMSVGLGLLNAVVSISVGLTVTLILLSIISTHFHLFVNNYFAAHSYSVAHGKNIVNVILVDFRAFDTLGEITVVAVAGIGVYGLLKAPRKVKVKK